MHRHTCSELIFYFILEQAKREISTAKLLKLSKRVNSELGLNCLAILGLGLTESDVERHIKNKSEFTISVYSLLQEWSNKTENLEDAYQILYEALGKDGVDMKNHRKVLKQNDGAVRDESQTLWAASWWAARGSSGSSWGGFSSEEAAAEAGRRQVPTDQFVWRVCEEMAEPMWECQ